MHTIIKTIVQPLAVAMLLLGMPITAMAQTAPDAAAPAPTPAPKQQKPNPYGSPLDTLLSTRFWTDVPPAQNFVKETRPDPKSLDYAPLVGTDPVRPKPRDAEGVDALQAELESGGDKNQAAAQNFQSPAPAAPAVATKPGAKSAKHARKTVPKKTTAAAAQ